VGSAPVLAGFQDDWIEMDPAALKLWERHALTPYANAKNVAYCALVPGALRAEAGLFLRDLSALYDLCNFGTHKPYRLRPGGADRAAGLVEVGAPAPASAGALTVPEYLAGLAKACFELQEALWSNRGPPSNRTFPAQGSWIVANSGGRDLDVNLVVYVVCPFDEVDAVSVVMAESLQLLAPLVSPQLSSPLFQSGSSCAGIACSARASAGGLPGGGGEGRVQSVAAVQFLSRFGVLDVSQRYVRGTALAVYSKIRRHTLRSAKAMSSLAATPAPVTPGTPATPGQFSIDANEEHGGSGKASWERGAVPLLHEPAFILAHPYPPSQNPYPPPPAGEGGGASASSTAAFYRAESAAPPVHRIHGAYAVEAGPGGGERWLLAVWTDCRGELLETQALLLRPGAPAGGGPLDLAACELLLEAADKLVAAAQAACGREVALRDVCLVRVGPMPPAERRVWEECVEAQAASGLATLTLGFVVPETPLSLGLWPEASGASLLQRDPDPRAAGPAAEGAPSPGPEGCGPATWAVWMPSPAPAPATMVLPGEDGWARVTRVVVAARYDLRRPSYPPVDAGPAARKGHLGGPAGAQVALEAAAELNNLAVCSAAFHGVCTGWGAHWWTAHPHWRAVHGDTAHLPLHCKVLENLQMLLRTVGGVVAH